MWPHELGQPPSGVQGRTWGGNLEILSWLLQAGWVVRAQHECVCWRETRKARPELGGLSVFPW